MVEKESNGLLAKRDALLRSVGNIVEDDVPEGHDEETCNKTVTKWGKIPEGKINSTPGHYHHNEILASIDGYDPKRGSKIAGHKGYFLKGPGCFLNLAL